MIETLCESADFRLELDDSGPRTHYRSRGTYSVVDVRSGRVVYETANHDKSFGVFEFLTKRPGGGQVDLARS